MADHVLDLTAFRLMFPAFADDVKYPDVLLETRWTMATAYIAPSDGPLFSGAQLQLSLNFMTAHLQQSAVMIAAGVGSVIVKGSTIDKVQVQLEPPPTKSGWQWWLATTPYGLQLWALLQAQSAGGFYLPGLPERAAFRRVGGRFGPWR